MNNYNKKEIFFIIIGLVLINRYLYILMPLDLNKLIFTYHISKIDWQLSLSSLFLLASFLKFGYDYIIYNVFQKRKLKTIDITEYTIEEKKHSFLFWSVICFPLLLCPLPSNIYSFIVASILVFLLAILIAKHSNELILNPLFFFNGKVLYEIKGINNNNIYYIIFNNKIEDPRQVAKKQYLVIKDHLLLEKD